MSNKNSLTCMRAELFDISRMLRLLKGLFTCDEMRESVLVCDNEPNALTFSFLVTLARTTEA